jgi:flagellar protein FliO/FliZ
MRVAPPQLIVDLKRAGTFLNATIRCPIARARRIASGWALFACVVLQPMASASAAPFAAPEQVTPSGSSSGLLRMVIALLVVLGAVIAAGRFARRVRGFSGGANAALEVIGQLSVGPRERAVLIRVGERQLLLGVAPGNVRTLHVFEDMLIARESTTPSPDSAPADPAVAPRPSFKSLLLKSLGK